MEANQVLVDFVKALSKQKSSTPAQIALAWQFAKGVTAPIIGATKAKYFDDAVGTLNLRLTEDDISCLEELYVPHKIVGAI